MRTGTANLPLHGGKCPAWLFSRMKTLGAAIIEVVVEEFGPSEVLRRLSDPHWFQSLGCVLGFDWHSSGVTTTVCAALKEGLRDASGSLGVFFAGGKGRASRNTPHEIEVLGDRCGLSRVPELQYASRMAAKVDSSAVQDGYQIYHHFFAFTSQGEWAVVQQGMNEASRLARRYHWLSRGVEDFVCEPHAAVCCDQTAAALNLVAKENEAVRRISTEISSLGPERVIREIRAAERSLPTLTLPSSHPVPNASRLNRALSAIYDRSPKSFRELLETPGVGGGTLRALALVAEVAYGVKASYRDPAKYSFAHGGKDGYPFPVSRQDLEHSTRVLQKALKKARCGQHEQLAALRRLAHWHQLTKGD